MPVPSMSLAKARYLLKRLFEVLRAVSEVDVFRSCSPVVVNVRRRRAPGDVSPAEAAVLKRLTLLSSVRAELRAFKRLTPLQQRFCRYRYKYGYSLREVARLMGRRSAGSLCKLEVQTLRAFILALGYTVATTGSVAGHLTENNSVVQ